MASYEAIPLREKHTGSGVRIDRVQGINLAREWRQIE